MVYESFRAWLAHLEDKGELKRVKREVDRKLEIARVTKKSYEVGGPALLFENVKGFDMPVASAIYGTEKRFLDVMGATSVNDFLRMYLERAEKRISPKIVESGPVKEVIHKNDRVDVTKLPALWHAEKDGGYFITATSVIVKKPDSGTINASTNRLMIKGKDKLGIFFGSAAHGLQAIWRNWDKGKACPVAIAIGVDPIAFFVSGGVRIPYDEDEFEFMGALREKPIELVRCETVPLEVPANAEIVIEGEVPPHVMEPEGPFSEFPGYYCPVRDAPIIKVTAITHREKPIYHAILEHKAPAESHYVAKVGYLASIHRTVSSIIPKENIKAVYVTDQIFNAIVSIRKTFPGEGKQVACAVLSSIPDIKNVVVVDEDVDIFSPTDVEWAVTTRSRPSEDFVIIPNFRGVKLDTTAQDSLVTKLGIDATKPLNGDKIAAKSINDLVTIPTEDIDLKDYIGH